MGTKERESKEQELKMLKNVLFGFNVINSSNRGNYERLCGKIKDLREELGITNTNL